MERLNSYKKKWHKIRITAFKIAKSISDFNKIIEYQTKNYLKSLRFLSEKWVQHIIASEMIRIEIHNEWFDYYKEIQKQKLKI
jgi:plasmid rolling circle replication initiator protein Rep